MEKLEELESLFEIEQKYIGRLGGSSLLDLSLPLENPFETIDDNIYKEFFVVSNALLRYIIDRITNRLIFMKIGEYYVVTTRDSRCLFFAIPQNQAPPLEPTDEYTRVNVRKTDRFARYAKIAKDVYGEENVYYRYGRVYNMPSAYYERESLIIRKKNIEVLNKHDVVLKIPELFFELTSHSNGRLKTNLAGFRMGRSSLEHANRMIHPHLESGRLMSSTYFCIGDTGRATVPNAFAEAYENDEDDNIYNLLFVINAFLNWEDLDVVPFIKMMRLLSRTNSNSITYSQFTDLIKEEHINLYIDNGNIEVDLNTDDLSIGSEDQAHIIEGRSYKIEWDIYVRSDFLENGIYFNGEHIPRKVSTYNPFDMSKLESSNISGLQVPDRIKEQFKLELKSRIFSNINYELEPTRQEKRIKDTLIGLKEVSRLSQNNPFL